MLIRKAVTLFSTLILMSFCATVSAQEPSAAARDAATSSFITLTNRDVLRMVENERPSAEIIYVIESSTCAFDTFPPVLQDLARRGVPDEVLHAMVSAPHGPPASSIAEETDDGPTVYHFVEDLKQRGLSAAPASRNARGNLARRSNSAPRSTRTAARRRN